MLDLVLSPEVAEARVDRRAVVALESTLVAHGLPYPQNLEVAQELQQAVRDAGAIPATIAIVDGRPHIGLTDALLERLAKDGKTFAKAGSTDLAVHMTRGKSAATTVSATAMLAARAKIKVFATGGIGGVHRGDAGDVSHDLVALAKTPIAVISAGAKAILDLPRTLETLETLGVLVVGYRTDEMPAFYTVRSGLRLEHFAGTAADLSAILKMHWEELGGGGVLVANPIPSEASLDERLISDAIATSLLEASAAGITGKALTPFLLARLADVTGGASVRANRALALHNAKVGAELAIALNPHPIEGALTQRALLSRMCN
ncbi:MAG TPA: pseudouridine-5'-phosphate glycosidase [Kofleriaceae bacterium]|nr:pseudouridine-5'-phosphate glycosidase [Kofleriaceae bacterium]